MSSRCVAQCEREVVIPRDGRYAVSTPASRTEPHITVNRGAPIQMLEMENYGTLGAKLPPTYVAHLDLEKGDVLRRVGGTITVYAHPNKESSDAVRT